MKNCVLLFVAIAMHATGQAQFLGIEAGGSVSNMVMTINSQAAETGPKIGGRIGIVRDEPVSDRLSTQYGLFYNAKGSSITYQNVSDGNGATITRDVRGYYRVDYVEIPISLLYYTAAATKNRFFFGGGPYLGVAFGGLVSINQNVTHVNGTTNTLRYRYLMPATIGQEPHDDYTWLDGGFQLQAGYAFTKGYYTRMHFSMGLANISPNPDYHMQNYSLSLTVGYMLR